MATWALKSGAEVMNRSRCFLAGALAGLLLSLPAAGQQQQGGGAADRRQTEEGVNYYQKWLSEDVVYIISSDERAVFDKLTTDEEREQFIEQFWYRRDPDPLTPTNEFKEEHYRRIAYANERFTSGVPGWKTDRGRIYIIHGPPAEIESHRSGENYQRPTSEGGGFTTTEAFEIWRYRRIEGIGVDVELEFVDPSGSGEFRLARNPWEKDRLLLVPGSGLTEAESLGLATRAQHPYFTPYSLDKYPLMSHRTKDDPFTRYETLAKVQRPTTLKYNDLKQLVEVNIGYQSLPFQVGEDYFRINDQSVLTPVTLEIQNKDLTFQEQDGVYNARIAVYGIITSITHRVVAEFDDDLQVSYPPDRLEQGRLGRSIYQKVFNLDNKLRYRLDVIVKDLNSGNIGSLRTALAPPRFPDDRLSASPLMLSDSVTQVPDGADRDQMFVLGDLKIQPNLSGRFPAAGRLGIYFQLYQVALDASSGNPSLSLRYRLKRDGKQVKYWSDDGDQSIYYLAGPRTTLLRAIPLDNLPPGEYLLEVEAEDHIRGEQVHLKEGFSLFAADSTATSKP